MVDYLYFRLGKSSSGRQACQNRYKNRPTGGNLKGKIVTTTYQMRIFGINRTTGSKVMAKKLFWPIMNFLAITFYSVDGLIPNFEGAKICKGGGLFAEAVKPLSQ